ncbi:GH25 family lysozyme [Arthrobacter antibioticus]|uniref:GH25 family lysozyme n=1 Tax=Arthrobacter sp. H35-MC1 TaxID=3046203 RepID=UPI0024BB2FB3|nr:GH25 family lysozyme [Arthrobacter sp. H35-MC1]MDJ0316478.1 GH25 family lysozyme [Arthrobacter sp. H35-MC1]
MGQAGKNIPNSPGLYAASPFSTFKEPTVNEQPPGTDGLPLGLDVSGWQGNVNWVAVKNAGARFAYVKTSEGPWTLNDYFAQQYNGAAGVGIIRGGYHFARPNLSSGSSQAKVMLESGGGWTSDGMTLPPALDIEDNPYVKTDKTNLCYGLSPTALVGWISDFTQTIRAATGRDAVIYTSYYFWQQCLGGSQAFASANPLWIAAYYASSPWMPGKWAKHTFWQYANDYADQAQTKPATFPGDQNVFNGTIEQLRELASGVKASVIGMPKGATSVSGKWAGDNKSYIGWFKNGKWCMGMPRDTSRCFYYGDTGDQPIVGDWNGDGHETVGVVRGNSWFLNNNLNKLSVDVVQYYGNATDIPIVGDWNADGRTSIGVFRAGSWYMTNSHSTWPEANIVTHFGNRADTPLVGDWNGDGKDTTGVWRNGFFYLTDTLSPPIANTVFAYGIRSDTPTTGDWNGNGETTVGIERSGTWHLTNSLRTLVVDSRRS